MHGALFSGDMQRLGDADFGADAPYSCALRRPA